MLAFLFHHGCATTSKDNLMGNHSKLENMKSTEAEPSQFSEMHNEEWYGDAASQGRGIKHPAGENIKSFDDYFISDTARGIERNLGYE
jgi:hypothetical protein